MNRGPAIWATATAVGLINIGLAALIVIAIGAGGFIPIWLGLSLVLAGIVAAAVAVSLWRGYQRSLSG